jgi:Ser/Thr protein kinase RdoA (MazF antagonist)
MSDPRYSSRFSCAPEIATAALERWTVLSSATLTPVKVRENAVFRATNLRGDSYALRIHRPGYHSDHALHSEYVWMRVLRDEGVLTPREIPSLMGRPFEIIVVDGVRYQVDLFEWITGSHGQIPLGGGNVPTEVLQTQYRLMGIAMARMHQISASWSAPAEFQRHAWDSEGLVGETPLWGRFWELQLLSDAQRQLMLEVRARLREELGGLPKTRERYGMIHADLTPDNVIVAGDSLYLIDFDDAGFGWHLFDIAVSLFSFTTSPRLESVREAFLSGYCSQKTLSEPTLACLPMFLAARGTTLLGWLNSRQQSEALTRAPWLIDMACTAAARWLG